MVHQLQIATIATTPVLQAIVALHLGIIAKCQNRRHDIVPEAVRIDHGPVLGPDRMSQDAISAQNIGAVIVRSIEEAATEVRSGAVDAPPQETIDVAANQTNAAETMIDQGN